MPRSTTMDTQKQKDSSIDLSYPMLARNNYTAWSLKMKVFMQAQNVWEAVEPSVPKLAVEVRMDKVALAAIYQGIQEEILLSIAEKKSAKESWDAIKTMYMGADRVQKAKVQTLKIEFESMNMKESDNLDEFCMKTYGLVMNIRILREKMEEVNVVKKLLRAVPSKYLQIASTIEQFGNMEEMTVEEVVGCLKAHEERLKGQTENSGGQLLFTQEEWSKRSKGCLAYMKIPSVHVKKLDDRSKPVVYLGKETCSKAHRLSDPSSKTVHVSRDVEFEESEGWT